MTVLTRAQFEESGKLTLGDFLQTLPEQGNAPNFQLNNGGSTYGADGSTRINLRNLGVTRTLVLVNGRRFVPGGLYLLDEPEAPLSPQSQLALLAMIGEMVSQDAQFIIATHSPMLLAFPGAQIYSFDKTPLAAVAYEDLDHVRITRDFLNAPARYLKQILEKEEPPLH